MKFTNILVPFDKSDHALHALTLAKGLAEEDPAIKLHVIGVVFVSDIPPALGLDANPYESAPPLVIQPDLYKKLVEAALDREKDDMKHAIGGLLDGMPNDVDIAAVNAPSPVDGINDAPCGGRARKARRRHTGRERRRRVMRTERSAAVPQKGQA